MMLSRFKKSKPKHNIEAWKPDMICMEDEKGTFEVPYVALEANDYCVIAAIIANGIIEKLMKG